MPSVDVGNQLVLPTDDMGEQSPVLPTEDWGSQPPVQPREDWGSQSLVLLLSTEDGGMIWVSAPVGNAVEGRRRRWKLDGDLEDCQMMRELNGSGRQD